MLVLKGELEFAGETRVVTMFQVEEMACHELMLRPGLSGGAEGFIMMEV